MKPVRTILMAVKDTGTHRRAFADKAIGIAKALGAKLEFFNAISAPVFLQLEPLTGTTISELKRESLALRTRHLEKWVARARQRGVSASCAVEWDFPPHEAIVRRAKRIAADLVIAEVHQGMRLTPWLMHLTDWELLRECPVPVLLLKNAKPWRRPVILAGVDPSHAHSKPSGLDDAIVDRARALARKLAGSAHVLHANSPSALGLSFVDPAMDVATLSAVYEAQKAQAKKTFESFVKRKHVPPAHRHLLESDPVLAIPKTARRLQANLVVMGALSRSGIKRVFIGNTAERVLESLPCDVLVLKPPGTAPRVARAPRGMRVFTPAPAHTMHV